MPDNAERCEQCGARLPASARFCEICGAPVGARPPAPAGARPAQAAEAVIGHLPAERTEKTRSGLGWKPAGALTLVISTRRLLLLRETDEVYDTWVSETEGLIVEEEQSGRPWRELMDAYDWRSPVWAHLYNTPPDALLAAHRDNEAIALDQVISAEVALADDCDALSLLLADGNQPRFPLKNQSGRPAAIFLAQALGPERVRVTF